MALAVAAAQAALAVVAVVVVAVVVVVAAVVKEMWPHLVLRCCFHPNLESSAS